MDEFEKLFCGEWVCVRTDNLRESMEAMSMQKEDIDFFMENKPKMKIVRQGDKVFHSTDLGRGVMHDITYEFGKEFEAKDNKRDPPLYHNKLTCTFENGKLTFESRSQLTGPRKIDVATVMFVKDGELISDSSPLNDRSIVGRRIYKKA
ncbi:uncharacterized protein LOC123549992 [Mercenaria mercenaria]|uniref:uncharacterized protein LOC123549992 n=1 Tax=Mercenaria mercenaria TaxID=6596 RepID=UPI00234F5A71|nr:uncharacterized protein LOC123549992 [Mercenaria mercenaria]